MQKKKESRRRRMLECHMIQLWRLRWLDGVKNQRPTRWNLLFCSRRNSVVIHLQIVRTRRSWECLTINWSKLRTELEDIRNDIWDINFIKDQITVYWCFYCVLEEYYLLYRICHWYRYWIYFLWDLIHIVSRYFIKNCLFW